MDVSTLRPGLLVSINTSMAGNVQYRKQEIVADHLIEKARFCKWETERTISDAEEHALATKARSEATYAVGRVCASTPFGYLCPEEKREQLDAGIADARAIVDAFNSVAKVTRINLYIMTGRVAADDVAAVRAIRSELSGLLSDMQYGVGALDASKVRDAAARAKQLSTMLSDAAKGKVESAVEAARKAATVINKAVKAGEQAAIVIDEEALKAIQNARTSFLDLDGADVVIQTPVAPSRAVEFASEGV
jgi:hypothetical protein